MTQPDPANPTFDYLLATICGFILPFFLAAAGGNQEAARTAVLELIDAYHPATSSELDLAGRIIGFSIVAMDNLRLSMGDDLSDTKVLRYRSNAVALSRAAEQARQILQAIQEKRENTREIPRPMVAAAPAPPPSTPKPESAQAAAPSVSTNARSGKLPPLDAPPMDIEAMKRDARVMMAAFSRQGIQASTAIASIPDPNTFVKSFALPAVRRA